MDSKWFARCETCGKRRLYIAKRQVKLPIGQKAKSQKLMCRGCFRAVETMLSMNKNVELSGDKPKPTHGRDNLGG